MEGEREGEERFTRYVGYTVMYRGKGLVFGWICCVIERP